MLRGGQPPEQVSHTHPLMDGPVVSFRPTVASLPTYSCTTRSSLLAPDILNAIHAYCTRPQDLGATSDGIVFLSGHCMCLLDIPSHLRIALIFLTSVVRKGPLIWVRTKLLVLFQFEENSIP